MTEQMQNGKAMVEHLVEKYKILLERGKINTYNEAPTRVEFIEPLFKALGWDMDNHNGLDEVKTEEQISNGRVDLAFRVNGIPAFFLEAKAMKVDLDEWKWAEQAINYSWNKSVSWAILTDFEAIKIFNSEIPPTGITENLFIEIKWDQYLSHFDQLWLLSRESFEKNELSKLAEKWGKITKRKNVSDKLFEDLIAWRLLLTSNIRKLNPSIHEDEIDEGVQRILDRLIFIRTAEDRKIDSIVLQPLIRRYDESKKPIYKELIKLFRIFDENYNSKIFSQHASEKLLIDDSVIYKIIMGLYLTTDGFRYDFSLISADVLGGIYEEYLGNVLAKKRTKLTIKEDAKKKRKGGIYYTPQYIVKFIVSEAFDLLEKKKKTGLKDVRLLDMASGSGSFLIEAHEYLYDYIKRSNQEELFSRLNILKDNIYGVDLDQQAVEISQLNLLLKTMLKKELLPNLQHNILRGNSLVSEGDSKLCPFDYWESFPEIKAEEGFDIVVGNPPYIKEFVNKEAFDGFRDSEYYEGKMDIWTGFACRAIDLLKPNGVLGFIAPNNWIVNAGAKKLRNKILTEGEIVTYIDFNDFKVFKKAGIQTMIMIFQKRKPRKSYQVNYAKVIDNDINEIDVMKFLNSRMSYPCEKMVNYTATIQPSVLKGKNITFSDDTEKCLLDKILAKSNFALYENEVIQGIIPAPDKYFVVPEINQFQDKELQFLKEYYTSCGKYFSGVTKNYLFYLCDKNFKGTLSDYPNIKEHFQQYKNILTQAKIKYKTPDKPFFFLHRERDESFFKKGPKIVSAIRTKVPSFFYTENEYYGSRALNFIKTERVSMEYLTGLFNSKVVHYWLLKRGKPLGAMLQIDTGPLLEVPLVIAGKDISDKIIISVREIQKQYAELLKYSENTDKYQAVLSIISKEEKKIDSIVYQLYDLSDDDIFEIENCIK